MPDLITLIKSAGDAVMTVYHREFSIEEKADKSPVTEADLLAHRIICDGLAKLSDVPVLSEESADEFNADGVEIFWCVDPVDGTKEFINKNGEFTVNIALIDNGEPILGLVYAPDLQWLYYAAEGYGAFKQIGDATPQAIQVSPIKSDETVRVVGSRSHFSGETKNWLEARFANYELVPMGSALKICLVAEGKADIYPRFGPTCWWDTAAAHAVAVVAGADVITPENQPLRYQKTQDNYLNPFFIIQPKT